MIDNRLGAIKSREAEPELLATLRLIDAPTSYRGRVEFNERGVVFTGVPVCNVVGLPDQTFFAPYCNISKVEFS
jgi:hypothetical protein